VAKPIELYMAKPHKNRATGNAILAMVALTLPQGCSKAWFLREITVTFSKFLVKPNFDLETNYIFRKPTNRRFQRYIDWTEILSNFLHEPNTFLCQRRNGKSRINKPT